MKKRVLVFSLVAALLLAFCAMPGFAASRGAYGGWVGGLPSISGKVYGGVVGGLPSVSGGKVYGGVVGGLPGISGKVYGGVVGG
ncbi:MAG: hypothetical protein LBU47_07775, partial [Christensenellaceae bacterium]|nr:hypothetical protein [Christensenellaceae bacterium]